MSTGVLSGISQVATQHQLSNTWIPFTPLKTNIWNLKIQDWKMTLWKGVMFRFQPLVFGEVGNSFPGSSYDILCLIADTWSQVN